MALPFKIVMTGQSLIHDDIREYPQSTFAEIVRVLKGADVAFTNLETTLLGPYGGWPMKGSYFGCADSTVLDALQDIGINALALANNHAFDLGPSGILSSLEAVGSRSFLSAGIGIDRSHAALVGRAVIGGHKFALAAMDAGPGPDTMYADDKRLRRPPRPGVNGLAVSRVFDIDQQKFDALRSIQELFGSTALERANYAQPNDPAKLDEENEIDFYGTIFRRSQVNCRRILIDRDSADRQLNAISDAARWGNFVIAYLHHHHWEPDWREVPDWVRAFAHACVDAGAQAFVSHGAPVLQPIEIYRDTPIFYGLGNFIFHIEKGETHWSPAEAWKSVVATCQFNEKGHLQTIDLLPIVIGGQEQLDDANFNERRLPFPATGEMAEAMINDLADRSAVYGTLVKRCGGLGKIEQWR